MFNYALLLYCDFHEYEEAEHILRQILVVYL